MVTDNTAGIATGIEATVRISANCTRSSHGRPRSSSTPTSTTTSADAHVDQVIADRQHRLLEMRGRTGLLHQGAVRPRYVRAPVAKTTPVISPWRAIDPE